jgi:hypothetical protein
VVPYPDDLAPAPARACRHRVRPKPRHLAVANRPACLAYEFGDGSHAKARTRHPTSGTLEADPARVEANQRAIVEILARGLSITLTQGSCFSANSARELPMVVGDTVCSKLLARRSPA